MGAQKSKLVALPIPVVLKKMNECVIPEDRNLLIDYFEMMDINMCNVKDLEINTRQLKEANGMSVCMRVFRRMIEDDEICFVSLQLLETVKFNTTIVMDVIQYGGLDILSKAKKIHESNEFIHGSIPRLLKCLIGKYS